MQGKVPFWSLIWEAAEDPLLIMALSFPATITEILSLRQWSYCSFYALSLRGFLLKGRELYLAG